MSTWRRIALENLPECKKTIAEAENPMAMWINLCLHFEDACKDGNDDLIERFYRYAWWCWNNSNNSDLRSAVSCAFYEHLPLKPEIRKDLTRWIGKSAFAQLREVFAYHLSQEEFSALEEEFTLKKPKRR